MNSFVSDGGAIRFTADDYPKGSVQRAIAQSGYLQNDAREVIARRAAEVRATVDRIIDAGNVGELVNVRPRGDERDLLRQVYADRDRRLEEAWRNGGDGS